VTLAGDEQAALIGNQAARAAGSVKFDDLGLDVASDIDERRRAVAGPRDAHPGEEVSDG
jgi:hypothetical protein